MGLYRDFKYIARYEKCAVLCVWGKSWSLLCISIYRSQKL